MDLPSGDGELREREAELAVLAHELTQASAGHGRVVLVEGTAGIGKTRLLDHFCRSVESALVLRGRGGEQEQGLGLLVTRELFASYLRRAPSSELARAFAGAAELAAPLVGRARADSPPPDPGFATVHGMYWLIANLADERPVLLAIDDAHWADLPTQRWLAYLLPRIAELRVLVIVAVRPRELEPTGPLAGGLAAASAIRVVRPSVLSAAASAGLVRCVVPDATDEFCRSARRATGGNPLLLQRLALEARDNGADSRAVEDLAEAGEGGLGGIILPRLHALGRPAVDLARAAALLGDDCTLTEAAEVAGLSRELAERAFAELVRREFLADRSAPSFVHPLVRAVVTGELSAGERIRLHRVAGGVLHRRGLDPERVARHLVAAAPTGEEWVRAVLADAAALAGQRGAPETALVDLLALLCEDLDPSARCAALLEAGVYAFRCNDPGGIGLLEQALDQAPDAATAVRAWFAVWNWRLILRSGHDPEGVLVGLPAHLDGELALAVQANFRLDFGFTGAHLRDRVHDYPTPATEPSGATPAGRNWLAAAAIDGALTAGEREVAVDRARRAFAAGRILEESVAGDAAYPAWIFMALLAAGELDEAGQVAEQIEEHARRRGSLLPAEWARGAVCLSQLARGDVRTAEATVADWLQRGHEVAAIVVRPSLAAVAALVHLGRGRLEDAEQALDRQGYWTEDPPGDFHGAVLLHARGQVRLAAGKVEAALADFLATGRVLESFGCAASPLTPWRGDAALCSVLLGRSGEARAWAEAQLADARTWGSAPFLGRSLGTFGAVVGGAEGIALAEDAVSVLMQSEARAEHAVGLLTLGRLLRHERRPGEARPHLVEALDLCDRLGAVLLGSHVEHELRLAGGRPRRRAVSGVDSLTPAELRTAQLAAEGLSNPEIAQTLFVTRKTVEKHLGGVFSKLHISSRDQLAAVLGR